MPNYRYHTPESNRRGYCGCSSSVNGCNQQQSNVRPRRESCEVPYCDCDTAGEMSCAVKGRYDTLGLCPLADVAKYLGCRERSLLWNYFRRLKQTILWNRRCP